MQTFPNRKQFENDASASILLQWLEEGFGDELSDAILYLSFPLYRDEEGGAVVPDCLMISRYHGVIALAMVAEVTPKEIERCGEIVEQVPSYVHSRLVRNRALRKGATQLSFGIDVAVFAPHLDGVEISDAECLVSSETLCKFVGDRKASPLSKEVFDELVGTLDGAKGLIRPTKREVSASHENSKGELANRIETSITLFDQKQKHGMMGRITGAQRIRGLAGSGKTVVLAMKAALTLIQYPDAKIAYTFHTKSLYQHVKRLVTRFYRQFDDRDPDWEKNFHILHGWGSKSTPGIYSVACECNGVQPMTYQEAAASTFGDKFGFACEELLKQKEINSIYDYIFVDEGQDFPLAFIRLCHSLAKNGKFVLAYDDLQTIFQPNSPDTATIFGVGDDKKPKATFEDDVVLEKCYRNPREILVVAHALGFGLYGKEIVQMLESKEHWKDIGYNEPNVDLQIGVEVAIERPERNSLTIISERNTINEIVKVSQFESLSDEVKYVVDGVASDIADGLRPEDILVVCVDDRNAKDYLSGVEGGLFHKGISTNNLHSDSYGIRDFTAENRVTLATVHKAKGNEAFMVYVVGCDAVMFNPDIRRRNMLFTAMTRAKGWVRVSGAGEDAAQLLREVNAAKENFPYLRFQYPDPNRIKVSKRDLSEIADKKMRAKKLLDDFSYDELKELLREKGKGRAGYAKRRGEK